MKDNEPAAASSRRSAVITLVMSAGVMVSAVPGAGRLDTRRFIYLRVMMYAMTLRKSSSARMMFGMVR